MFSLFENKIHLTNACLIKLINIKSVFLSGFAKNYKKKNFFFLMQNLFHFLIIILI